MGMFSTMRCMFAMVVQSLKERGFMLIPRMPLGVAYTRDDFFADLIAGLTVAAVLIPQAIAYALLAGLPPAHGFGSDTESEKPCS